MLSASHQSDWIIALSIVDSRGNRDYPDLQTIPPLSLTIVLQHPPFFTFALYRAPPARAIATSPPRHLDSLRSSYYSALKPLNNGIPKGTLPKPSSDHRIPPTLRRSSYVARVGDPIRCSRTTSLPNTFLVEIEAPAYIIRSYHQNARVL